MVLDETVRIILGPKERAQRKPFRMALQRALSGAEKPEKIGNEAPLARIGKIRELAEQAGAAAGVFEGTVIRGDGEGGLIAFGEMPRA